MPETPPNGRWKGIAVGETGQVTINLHLHFEGETVTGQYELPNGRGDAPAGSLKGTYVPGGALLLNASSGILARLEGRIEQTAPGKWVIFGLVRRSQGGEAVSITAFFAPQKIITFASVYDGDQFGGEPGAPAGD